MIPANSLRVAVVSGWVALACLANVTWIHANVAPLRMWDDSEYLAGSVDTYHALERGDLKGFIRAASRPARGVHPPMTELVPLPMYVIFGPDTRSALYAYTCLIPLFCLYAYLLARAIVRDTAAAALAVVIMCTFPLTYGLWRHAMAEFGVGVAALGAQFHLLRVVRSRQRRAIAHAAAAGAFIGWGMLWKISFPVFVLGPLVYAGHQLVSTGRRLEWRTNALALITVGASVTLISGPFYLRHFRAVWRFLVFNSTRDPSLEQYTFGPPFSPLTVLKYWTGLVNIGASGYFLILFLVLCLISIVRTTEPRRIPERPYLIVCALPPFIVFSFHQLKEPRHVFPVYFAAAVLLAWMLNRHVATLKPGRRAVALGCALALPIYQDGSLSSERWWTPGGDIRLGPLVLLYADRDVPHFGGLPSYAYRANSTEWPVDDVVSTLTRRTERPEREVRVRFVGHIPFISGPVINHASQLRHGPRVVYNLPSNISLASTWWDYLVVSGGPVHQSSETREPLLARLLEEGRLPFNPIGSLPLPDARDATFYERARDGQPRVSAVGENLVTAVDGHGEYLFPARRRTSNDLSGTVVVDGSAASPLKFEYVYVPVHAATLRWRVLRTPAACSGRDLDYGVTVFDLPSARGPRHTISQRSRVRSTAESDSAELDVQVVRGAIVTIRLSFATEDAACIALGDLHLSVASDAPAK